ncbi:hypothetical protein ACMZ29_16340 [Brevibacterium casei]|uniref:hypothetical protein n=1 Tax=Brevibacterium casei TaxID=33889 RepID=UPI0039F07F9B
MHQYAAGLIDGEGYIGIQASGGSYQVRLKIGMSDKGKPALEQMVRLYGGRIDEGPARNDRYRDTATWVVTGERAAEIIREVKPWLFVKAEAAEIALQLQLMLEVADKLPNGRREWTAEMRERAEELRSRIQQANRRGPDPEPNPRIPDSMPVAKYRGGTWWDSVDSLFGPEHFDGKFPASGKMIDGVVYEHTAPHPVPPTGGNGSSSSPGLLRTPCAAEAEGGMLHPDKAEREGQTLRLSSQIVHMVAPDQLKDDLLPTLATGGKLLPTPQAHDAQGSKSPEQIAAMRAKGYGVSNLNETVEHQLLPTPKAGDADFGLPRTSGRPPEKSTHLATRLHYTDFGQYAPAIERWEAVTGRKAPAPTELTDKGKHRLSAAFVEWLMGLADEWVTDPDLGLSRASQLRALGNGVVPQQAVYAITWLIDRAHITLRRTA